MIMTTSSYHDGFEVPEWEEIASEGMKVDSVPCVPIFDTGERLAKDLFQKGMTSRKDVLSALKLASLKTKINYRMFQVSPPLRSLTLGCSGCVTGEAGSVLPMTRSVGRGYPGWSLP